MISPAVITLIVLVAAAVLFISEKIPVPLTAMLCLAVLVLTGIVTPADMPLPASPTPPSFC